MHHLIIEDWGGNTQFNPLKRIKELNHYHTERQAGGMLHDKIEICQCTLI